MDDFYVLCDMFDYCLLNLSRSLQRCDQDNLVLNWEKCDFIVIEVTVLGHKVSLKRIKVDKAKIEVIKNFSTPISIKGVWSF